jgi:hypothetical protein
MKDLKKDTCKYLPKDFHGGGTTRLLVCYNEKIVVPTKKLQKHVIDWYRLTLCHSGINRTESNTQHLFWPKMQDQGHEAKQMGWNGHFG